MRRAGGVALAVGLVVLMSSFVGTRLAEVPEAGRSDSLGPLGGEVHTFAASLRGTYPDGRLTVRGGTLLPDPELLYLFDYYLSVQGEKSVDQIVAAIGEDLRRRLASSPEALVQAERLLARYIDYKRALLTLELGEAGAEAGGKATSARLEARLQRVRALRSQFFSDYEVASLFGLAESRDAEAIRRLAIFESEALSLAEKQAIFAQLDLGLPSALAEEREAPRRIQNVETQVALMRASGANEQDVYQFRVLQFSPDATRRLQQLDGEERAWASRIGQYEEEVRLLLRLPEGPLRIPATTTPSQRVALEMLRSRHFSPREQRRLAAYESGM